MLCLRMASDKNSLDLQILQCSDSTTRKSVSVSLKPVVALSTFPCPGPRSVAGDNCQLLVHVCVCVSYFNSTPGGVGKEVDWTGIIMVNVEAQQKVKLPRIHLFTH